MERGESVDVAGMEIDLIVLEESDGVLSVSVDDGVEEQVSAQLTDCGPRHLI